MIPLSPAFNFRNILLLLLVVPSLLFAFRPFITDDAGTVVPETFELETAVDYWQDDATLGLCFKHGVTGRMDIGVAFGRCVLPQDKSSYDPAELLLKFGLIPGRLSASFSGSFGNHCYSTNAIYSQPFPFCELHANIGFSTESTLDAGFGTYSIAGVVPAGRFMFGAELGGSQEALDWWQTGGRFEITPAIAVDAALGSTVGDDIEWTATSGLFIAFPFEKGE